MASRITGSTFRRRLIAAANMGKSNPVIPEVTGSADITGFKRHVRFNRVSGPAPNELFDGDQHGIRPGFLFAALPWLAVVHIDESHALIDGLKRPLLHTSSTRQHRIFILRANVSMVGLYYRCWIEMRAVSSHLKPVLGLEHKVTVNVSSSEISTSS